LRSTDVRFGGNQQEAAERAITVEQLTVGPAAKYSDRENRRGDSPNVMLERFGTFRNGCLFQCPADRRTKSSKMIVSLDNVIIQTVFHRLHRYSPRFPWR
jgi:hypothetical protein